MGITEMARTRAGTTERPRMTTTEAARWTRPITAATSAGSTALSETRSATATGPKIARGSGTNGLAVEQVAQSGRVETDGTTTISPTREAAKPGAAIRSDMSWDITPDQSTVITNATQNLGTGPTMGRQA